MSAPVDQSTRDLVATHGLDRTLFVEAGAGTGKTTALVQRVANLVLVEGVGLDQVAAITFTEAAATELRTRIRVRFEEELEAADAEGGGERAARCRQAIAAADLAAITTLHGFASRLLNEFAVAAHLPPRVSVLDEVSSQLAHEERWSRFVDAVHDDPGAAQLLRRAAVLDVALEPRYQGHATLKDVAVELNQSWDRLTLLVDVEPTPLAPIDLAPVRAALADLDGLPERCADPADTLCCKLVDDILPALRAVAEHDDPLESLGALDSLGPRPWRVGNKGRKASWDDVKDARALVEAANAAVDAVVSTAVDEVLRHLLVRIAGEVVAAAEERRHDGGLEFHDLLVLARRMLRDSDEARRALHDRYTHILLDEFQDTDPLQIELATLIAASVEGVDPGRWHELAVDEGRLFFVGDPKQSIYRFRRADIELFLRAREHFGGGDGCERLSTNFRTVAPVLDWVNELFDRLMGEGDGVRQPRYEPLHPARYPTGSHGDHRPVLLGGEHPDPDVRAGTLREAEAADVAAVVTDIATHPERWPVDDGNGGWRAPSLGDVTVLVPTRTSLPYLRAALDGAGLPYRLATGTLVYATQEVRDALAAVRAIDDPTDTLSLVAALRSPLYACSDVDLFTFRRHGGRFDLRPSPPDAVLDDHPVRRALAHLRSLWEQRWWLGPATLLERLLAERGAHLAAFGDPRPHEVWRRLRLLVDQARTFEEAEGASLRGFVAWAELQGADSARVHEPLLPETDDDAVRIMTVHGAKGLEFPITILSGMTTRPGGVRRGVSVLWGEDGPPEVRVRAGLATADHEPRADLEAVMDTHEKLRLLYVATTRARDHLVVSCHHKGSDGGRSTYAGRIWTELAERDDLWRPWTPSPTATGATSGTPATGDTEHDRLEALHRAEAAVVAASDEVDAERDAWMTQREALVAPWRTPRVTSATAVARAATGAEELPDEDDDGADHDDDATVPQRRRGRAGTAIGQATHGTLQVLDLADPHHIDAQVRRQCEHEGIPDHVEVVAAMVRSALASDAVALAATHPHHKELYLAAPVGARTIEGYVDLLVEGPDGLVVVDYKTDGVREADVDAKVATYRLQGAAYAVALEAVTGQPVVECRFVFCRPAGAVERAVADLPTAMAEVRTALDHRATHTR